MAARIACTLVGISLHQGSPDQVARMLLDETTEIGIATESLGQYEDLVTLPCYDWQHVLVLPQGHPLLDKERISLEDLAQQPLITYHPTFTGRTRIDQAFAYNASTPNIVLDAIDPTSSRPTSSSAWAWGIGRDGHGWRRTQP